MCRVGLLNIIFMGLILTRERQIAGLSLWLRAQKSWQGQGLKAQQRPQIQKSNVICAEPMPGEVALLHEFLDCHLSDTPEQRLVGQLVLRVFEAMKLAGEAGSLLKIEQEISQDIEAAKQQWSNRPKTEQLALLTVETNAPQQQELSLQVGDITDERFWERVEDEIYQALNRYAEQVEGGIAISGDCLRMMRRGDLRLLIFAGRRLMWR